VFQIKFALSYGQPSTEGGGSPQTPNSKKEFLIAQTLIHNASNVSGMKDTAECQIPKALIQFNSFISTFIIHHFNEIKHM
jgi:hypothetical protein